MKGRVATPLAEASNVVAAAGCWNDTPVLQQTSGQPQAVVNNSAAVGNRAN